MMLKKIAIKTLRVFIKIRKSYQIGKLTKKPNHKPIRIGFIVQMPAIWDKQIDIYDEFLKKDNVDVFMFVVPKYNLENNDIDHEYGNNYFLNKYPNAIKVLNENDEIICLEKYNLDYLFYPRPYDSYLPKEIRSDVMYKYCKCCYMPYGLTGSKVFDDLGYVFFDNMYCCFMDSDYQKELLISHYPISYFLKNRKVYSLGYPVFSRFLDYPVVNNIKTITWTPRWSVDAKIGGSNFLEYKDNFLKMVTNKKYQYIFRPHPLMFDELIKKGFISEEDKNNFLQALIENNVLFDTECPIEEIFYKTDLLITDYSSIIPQFFVTNRPIIYCDKGIPINDDYKKIMKHCYIANSWNDVEENIKQILIEGDRKKTNRQNYISATFENSRRASQRIVNEIIKNNL